MNIKKIIILTKKKLCKDIDLLHRKIKILLAIMEFKM